MPTKVTLVSAWTIHNEGDSDRITREAENFNESPSLKLTMQESMTFMH